MIAQLTGQVAWIGSDSLILQVNGVGYLVSPPAPVLQEARLEGPLSLWTEMIVREDGMLLFGFALREEQELFRILLSVQGVGARIALNLISTFGLCSLVDLLMHQDKKSLVRADGVGPRLAERLVIELKDKVAKFGLRLRGAGSPAFGESGKTAPPSPLRDDVVGALVSLGYRMGEALLATDQAVAQCGPEASLEMVIREALVRVSSVTQSGDFR